MTHEDELDHEHPDRQEWDRRYASTDRLFPLHPDDALVELAGDLPAGRSLDLGAGEGRNTLWLAARGWDATAVDLSAVALERLAGAAEAQGLTVRTVVGDMVEFLRGGESFDLVVVAFIHPSPAERPGFLAAAASAVAPGGHLFLIGHHLESHGRAGPPDPGRLYEEDLLAGGFPGLETLRLERRTRAGGEGEPIVDLVAWATRPGGEPPDRP